MNASSGSKRAQPPSGSNFVALGIVIAESPHDRLREILRPQPDVRLVRIADTAAGEPCYRVEVALPAPHNVAEAILVWRHVKEALLADLSADIGPIRIIET
jgi:hypothetical protein